MNIELVIRLQSGDALALQEVREIYGSRIYAHAMNVVRDAWDAEEVVQDVMWTAFKSCGKLDDPAAFEGWLFRVTRNAALMVLRRRKRVPIPVEDAAIDVATDHSVVNPFAPDRMYNRREALAGAERAFGELAPLNKRIFFEMDVQGRSKEDVAGDLGITISSLKSRLHRTRLSLRDAFVAPLAA